MSADLDPTDPHLATRPLPAGVTATADFIDSVLRADGQPADRLTLRWTWPGGTRPGAFVCVGLNPSGASSTEADATLIRVYGFAKREGFGSLLMLNLFSARATEPAELLTYPGRPGYGRYVAEEARREHDAGSVVVLAFGAPPSGALLPVYRERRDQVLDLLDGVPVWCLGVSKNGSPRHPLYLPGDAALSLWVRP